MRYNININQLAIISKRIDIDLYDAAILSFVSDWIGNSSATIVMHEDKPYTWISHKLIVDQLPMLKTRSSGKLKTMSKDTIYRRMKRLCSIGLLSKHPNSQKLGMPLYRGTKTLDSIKYGSTPEPSDLHPKGYGSTPEGGTDLRPNYNTIKDNTINNNKEREKKEKVPKKRKNVEEAESYHELTQVLDLLKKRTGFAAKIPKTYNTLLRYGAYKLVHNRLKEGHSLQEVLSVIDFKCDEWINDPKMSRYLTYDTLLRKSNFEKYLNQYSISKNRKHGKQQTISRKGGKESLSIEELFKLIDEGGCESGF